MTYYYEAATNTQWNERSPSFNLIGTHAYDVHIPTYNTYFSSGWENRYTYSDADWKFTFPATMESVEIPYGVIRKFGTNSEPRTIMLYRNGHRSSSKCTGNTPSLECCGGHQKCADDGTLQQHAGCGNGTRDSSRCNYKPRVWVGYVHYTMAPAGTCPGSPV